MNILKKIRASVYDLEFYKEVRTESVGKVIKYYFKLALLLGLAGLIVSSFTIMPRVNERLKVFVSGALAYYPKDLEVKITKGIVSTNVPEPYTLALPEAIKKGFNSEKAQKEGAPAIDSMFVIDTKLDHMITFDEFKAMKAPVFLGRNYILRYDEKDTIVLQDLSKVPDAVVNHAFLEKILRYADYVPYAIPVLCFFFVFVTTLMQLIWILLIAIVFFVIQKIAGRGLTYSESYKVCAYASTVPIIVGFIVILLSMPERFFILDIITIIIAFVNISKPASAVTV